MIAKPADTDVVLTLVVEWFPAEFGRWGWLPERMVYRVARDR